MTNEEKVQRAKNIAAQKAFEVYGATLTKLLEEQGIEVFSSISDTTHIHQALLMEKGKILGVACCWKFVSDPKYIEMCLATAKKEGQV